MSDFVISSGSARGGKTAAMLLGQSNPVGNFVRDTWIARREANRARAWRQSGRATCERCGAYTSRAPGCTVCERASRIWTQRDPHRHEPVPSAVEYAAQMRTLRAQLAEVI